MSSPSPSGSQSARALRDAIEQQGSLFSQHLEQQRATLEALQATVASLAASVETVSQQAATIDTRVGVAATDARTALDAVSAWSTSLAAQQSECMEAEPTPPPPQQSEPEPTLPQPPVVPPRAAQQKEERVQRTGVISELPRSLRLERPPTFDGAMDGDTVSSFVHKLDVLFTLTGLNDVVMRSAYAVTCLEKAAYTWYVSQTYRLEDLQWPQLKQDLLDHFRPIDYTFQARQELAKCKQTGDVRGYVRAFRLKLTRCQDVGQEEAKFRFIDGLYPEEQRHVRLAEPADFHQAAAIAERIAVTMPRRQNPQQHQQHHRGRNPQGQQHQPRGQQRMEMGSMGGRGGRQQSGQQRQGSGSQQRQQQGQQGQRRFFGECFYCKRRGHREVDCRKKLADQQARLGSADGVGDGAGQSGCGQHSHDDSQQGN